MMASIHWRCRASLPNRAGSSLRSDQLRAQAAGEEVFEVPSGEALVTEDDLTGADQLVVAFQQAATTSRSPILGDADLAYARPGWLAGLTRKRPAGQLTGWCPLGWPASWR